MFLIDSVFPQHTLYHTGRGSGRPHLLVSPWVLHLGDQWVETWAQFEDKLQIELLIGLSDLTFTTFPICSFTPRRNWQVGSTRSPASVVRCKRQQTKKLILANIYCISMYVGETQRHLEMRVKEHRDVCNKGHTQKSAIAKHQCDQQHKEKWEDTYGRATRPIQLVVKEALHIKDSWMSWATWIFGCNNTVVRLSNWTHPRIHTTCTCILACSYSSYLIFGSSCC